MNVRTLISIGSLALLTALSGTHSAQAAGGATDVQDVGPWRVYVERDNTGKFLGCGAYMPQDGLPADVEIAVLASAQFWLTLHDRSWHLGTDPVPVSLQADGRPLGTWRITPLDPRTVIVDLTGNQTAQIALNASNSKLDASIGTERKSHSLQGAYAAIGAVLNCVKANVGNQTAPAAAPQPPNADVPPPAPVAGSPAPVLLQCNLDDSMNKEEYIYKTEQAIYDAARAAARAGYDPTKVIANQTAVRDAKLPQLFPQITLILALDEAQNRITNRQAVSWGPAFTQTEVHWRETDSSGVRDYLVNRVTGAIVITNVLGNGSLGYWLYKGTCSVTTQRAF